MKKHKIFNYSIFTFLSLIIWVDFGIPVFASETSESSSKNYVEGEIIVKYKDSKVNLKSPIGMLKVSSITSSDNLEVKENIKEDNLSVLKITDDKSVEQKISEVENDPNVLYAEPNYIRYPSTINTNDTYKDLLWGLDNIGQTIGSVTGTIDADIDMPEAWVISEGTNNNVIVAVLDTGVAYNHPDLQANMWDGTNCKSDTGAVLGGCLHGYDYLDDDKDPLPAGDYFPSHGTRVSGSIAAIKNNGKGIVGIAPNAKIMALRFNYTVASEIKAINFARQNGAKIINASFGGGAFSQSEFDAINLFKQSGGLFVAASGNDNTNSDVHPYYPASYNLDNIISVAATDQNDKLATFSNYGLISTDVGAPGVNIYSTNLGTPIDSSDEEYIYGDGTSFASPQVAGLAALIWGTKSTLTASGIKDIILNSGDSISSLTDKTVSGKRINAFNALNFLSSTVVNISYSDSDKIVKAGDTIVISANFDEPIQDLPVPRISISGSNILEATPMTKVSNILYTYNYTVGSGDGISTLSILDAVTLDKGLSVNSTPNLGATFTIDNTPPLVSIENPSSLFTKSGPITYTITYTDADYVTLTSFDVILNTTGTVTGTVTISGTGNKTRSVAISNIIGDGTLGISIASGSGTDIAGNKTLAIGPSEIFTVDNTAPTNQDTVFNKSIIKKGGVPVDIISSGDVNNNVWFSQNGTSAFIESLVRTKAIDGTSMTILSPNLEGIYKIFVVDQIGNISNGSIATLTVDNTIPPTPIISSVATDNVISYEERNAIHIIGTVEANSLVTAILSDGVNTKTESQQLSGDNINYDIILDGTAAIPASLLSGTINVSVTSTSIAGNISLPSTLEVIQLPQVVVVSSGGGGGGGSHTSTFISSTTIPVIVAISPVIIKNTPLPFNILDCAIGMLFSPLTGAKCEITKNTSSTISTTNATSGVINIKKF